MSEPLTSKKGPLAGIRVLDLSTVILGPYATQILADLGADVIKIETLDGDITRRFGPHRNAGMTPIHLTLNRNKRSVALNLKNAEHKQAFDKLATGADVVIHNMKDKAARSLKIAYSDICRLRPDIVYCWASGYGTGGAYAGRPAYDDVIQGAAGLAGIQGLVNGEPSYVATIPADKTAALTMAYAVIAALFHRQKTGEGQSIEVPMMETMVSWTLIEHLWGAAFEPPIDKSGYPRLLTPTRRPFRTSDGWISVSPYTDAHWRAFMSLAGTPELADDPRFRDVGSRTKNIGMLYTKLAEALARNTTAHWMNMLVEADIPAAPVHTVETLLEDEHLKSVDFFSRETHPTEGALVEMRPPVRFSQTPAELRTPAPRLGEHTLEVLVEAGIPQDEAAAIAAA